MCTQNMRDKIDFSDSLYYVLHQQLKLCCIKHMAMKQKCKAVIFILKLISLRFIDTF